MLEWRANFTTRRGTDLPLVNVEAFNDAREWNPHRKVDPLLVALLVAMNPQLYLLHAGIPRMNRVAQAESVTFFDGRVHGMA